MSDFEREFEIVINDVQSINLGEGTDLDTMIRHNQSFFETLKRTYINADESDKPRLTARFKEMHKIYESEMEKLQERTRIAPLTDQELQQQDPEVAHKIQMARRDMRSQAQETARSDHGRGASPRRGHKKTRSKLKRVPRKQWTRG